ncbi:MAG: hypothetical protein WAO69_10230 [Aestuariivita sp.]|uniref:hypothetical protein n=1 Tax=Aestuariivita sp. TaxID=1872407 RepID=UPI003BB1AC9F
MTTVISRLYADEATAHGVVDDLKGAGFPGNTIDVLAAGSSAEAIAATRVNASDAEIYANKMQSEGVLVVVRAPFTPFGAARRAMEIVDSTTSIHAGVKSPNFYAEDRADPKLFLSVMTNHPRFFATDMGPESARSRGTVSEGLGWRLLSEHRTKRSASSGWHASTKLLPFPLLKAHKERNSVISGGKRMMYNPAPK